MVNSNDDRVLNPDEMIDHNNANFLQIENVMTIFVAYNQKNIQQGVNWDTWPDWELCLTAMSFDVAIESEDDSEEIKILRQHWLAVMQFIHDNQNISIDGYTVKIQGMYGNTFSFDISFEPEVWTAPGQVVKNIEEVEAKIGRRFIQRPITLQLTNIVEHNLGSMWVCPSHVPQFGGKQTYYTESMICMSIDNGETFPSALLSLLCLCIDDTKIWSIAFIEDSQAMERVQWMEENWPGGIPDQDWEYQ